jgi:hypothetical protein
LWNLLVKSAKSLASVQTYYFLRPDRSPLSERFFDLSSVNNALAAVLGGRAGAPGLKEGK